MLHGRVQIAFMHFTFLPYKEQTEQKQNNNKQTNKQTKQNQKYVTDVELKLYAFLNDD